LIRNEKPIVFFERSCHVTEKSEAIAFARRCRSSQLTGWGIQKEQSEKIEGQEGGEAQGVAAQKEDIYLYDNNGSKATARQSHETQYPFVNLNLIEISLCIAIHICLPKKHLFVSYVRN
jgi:hypothetical protein